jgi:hypothetical protein
MVLRQLRGGESWRVRGSGEGEEWAIGEGFQRGLELYTAWVDSA